MIDDARCPACTGKGPSVLTQSPDLVLMRCGRCGLVWRFIRDLDRAKVQQLQDGVYRETRTRAQVGMTYRMARDRLRTLTRFVDGGRLLEIGCATGEFLELAERSGFDVLGLDASGRYALHAAGRGLNVKHARLEDLDLEDSRFDVIAIFHLIEHVEDPGEFMARTLRLLRPTGLLFVITPNVDSATNRPFGSLHPNFRQPDHLFFYSGKTLGDLLSRAGYDVVSTTTREYPHHFFTSVVGLPSALSGSGDVSKTYGSSGDGPRSFARLIANHIAYFCGYLFYPVLRPYGMFLESRMKGHELLVIARKPG